MVGGKQESDLVMPTLKELLSTLDLHQYLVTGTVAGALGRSALSWEEISREADSVWEDGRAHVATVSMNDECLVEFHFSHGVFTHDGVNIHPPAPGLAKTSLLPDELERNQIGAKRFAIDDELVLLLVSGVAVHYRQSSAGLAVYKIDGRSLPRAVLETYFSSLCTK